MSIEETSWSSYCLWRWLVSSVFGHQATSNIEKLIFVETNWQFPTPKVKFLGVSQHPPRWARPPPLRQELFQFTPFPTSACCLKTFKRDCQVLPETFLFCKSFASKTSAGSLVSSWVSEPGAFSLARPGHCCCHQTDFSLRSMTGKRSLTSLAFIFEYASCH